MDYARKPDLDSYQVIFTGLLFWFFSRFRHLLLIITYREFKCSYALTLKLYLYFCSANIAAHLEVSFKFSSNQ